MVGAILTQNTAWTNVEKAISALKQSRALSLRVIARMPRRRLESLIGRPDISVKRPNVCVNLHAL